MTLAGAIRLWPTPDTNQGHAPNPESVEWRGNSWYSKKTGAKVQIRLEAAVGGKLNPTWVEWLQGFPLGWTDCGAWATPWSRRKRRTRGKSS